MIRPNSPDLDLALGKFFFVLDHGFIRVIDYMGNDAAVVQAARVSYGEGTKTLREDAGLIKYLIKNKHTSPLEACELKLHIKLPIFVARQWIRHRTASVNEYSARYSVVTDDFYIPEQFRQQDTKNRQGSSGIFESELNEQMRETLLTQSRLAYQAYQFLLNSGTARELARTILPVNFYTEWYWKIDLHNLLHFLTLRCDEHAQWEIRQYADVIASLVKLWVPTVYEAWSLNNGGSASV